MQLFTLQQFIQLIDNGSTENRDKDHPPVVRLFAANTSMSWLVNELDPEMPHTGFGLCDLGLGFPELGYLNLEEIDDICGRYAFDLERDIHFESKYPMSVYANAARMQQRITIEDAQLEQAAQALATKKLQP